MLKIFNYNKDRASKTLEVFLNKRKSTQKNVASSVYKIIQDVKRNGDKAVLNYEKKYSNFPLTFYEEAHFKEDSKIKNYREVANKKNWKTLK